MTAKAAASRSKADASTIGDWIRNGLRIRKNARLRLKATKVSNTRGGLRYEISLADLNAFKAKRRELGL